MYQVLTSPLAIIKVGGAPIGKIRNVRATENFRRARVVGLGELTPSELPAVEWSGTFSCSLYTVFLNEGVLKSMNRTGNSIPSFVNGVLFNEGINVDILMKRKTNELDPNGNPVVELSTFAVIGGAVLASEGVDIAEGQISGRDGSFEYMNPILYS